MGVVKGDRIKESQKLNRCTREAFWAYALLVDELPDDFGRFRANPRLIASHIAPRRTDIGPRHVTSILAQYEEHELVRFWEVDGERFGEFTNYKPTGNRYHRTPEPPWSSHVHQGSCLSTAIRRARDWTNKEEVEKLVLQFNKLRHRDGTGAPPLPSLPFPSVPSVPEEQQIPSPPAPPDLVLTPEKPRLAPAHRGGWPATASSMWPGAVPEGRIGRALGACVAKYGEAPTLDGLKRWLAAGNARFGPEVFATDAARWINGSNGEPNPSGRDRPLTAAQQTVATVQFVAERARAKKGGG